MTSSDSISLSKVQPADDNEKHKSAANILVMMRMIFTRSAETKRLSTSIVICFSFCVAIDAPTKPSHNTKCRRNGSAKAIQKKKVTRNNLKECKRYHYREHCYCVAPSIFAITRSRKSIVIRKLFYFLLVRNAATDFLFLSAMFRRRVCQRRRRAFFPISS